MTKYKEGFQGSYSSVQRYVRKWREGHRPDGDGYLELGYVPVDEEGSRLLFQVVTNAYERQSVIYTTNIEFSGWGRVFGDPDMATAIVDRTVHHGRMIRFEGESYRRTHALMG